MAQIHSPTPKVELKASSPFAPEENVLPHYPMLARMAHVEGDVTFLIEIDAKGVPTKLIFNAGNPLLRSAVKEAVDKWKFPQESFGKQVLATMEFKLNCASDAPQNSK